MSPDGFDEIIWKMAENIAVTNKTQSETFSQEIDWETTYSESKRTEIHHNIVSSIEELTKEWYDFSVMMINHKNPYWVGLYSLANGKEITTL